jgi:hypothetical protein
MKGQSQISAYPGNIESFLIPKLLITPTKLELSIPQKIKDIIFPDNLTAGDATAVYLTYKQ